MEVSPIAAYKMLSCIREQLMWYYAMIWNKTETKWEQIWFGDFHAIFDLMYSTLNQLWYRICPRPSHWFGFSCRRCQGTQGASKGLLALQDAKAREGMEASPIAARKTLSCMRDGNWCGLMQASCATGFAPDQAADLGFPAGEPWANGSILWRKMCGTSDFHLKTGFLNSGPQCLLSCRVLLQPWSLSETHLPVIF